jgi:NitT/TauT family transport system substrate-binding protein
MKPLIGLCTAVALAFGALAPSPARAEVKELRIAVQPGVLFFPMWIMRESKLVEKHAARMGLGEIKTDWMNMTSGGANAEALISGNVDVVAGGVSNLLILWSKSKGAVKAFAAVTGVPNILLTRDPNVKSIADFTEKNRIAVPTVKMSLQAIFLQMALEKMYGEGSFKKLDANMVQMGHADSTIALLDPRGHIDSHFSGPPFMQIAMKNPNVRPIAKSLDIIGEVTTSLAYASTKFYAANPKIIEAFVAALDEANELAKTDKRKASETYLAATKEKVTVDELVTIISEPGTVLSSVPKGTMKFAEHMHKVGTLDRKPASWKEYFHENMHGKDGS